MVAERLAGQHRCELHHTGPIGRRPVTALAELDRLMGGVGHGTPSDWHFPATVEARAARDIIRNGRCHGATAVPVTVSRAGRGGPPSGHRESGGFPHGPAGTRTQDRRIMSPLLLPTELPGRDACV